MAVVRLFQQVRVGVSLAGGAQAQSAPAGAISVSVMLQAASIAMSTPAGNLVSVVPLDGGAAASVLVSGAPAFGKGFAGTSAAQATVSGAPSVVKPLAGISASASAVTADLTAFSASSMIGAARGQADVRGDMQIAVAFDARALAQALAQANLLTSGSVALSGGSTGQASPAATLSLSLQVAGASGGVALGGGTLQVQLGGLSAELLSQALVRGALQVQIGLDGGAVAQTLAAGALGRAIDDAVPLRRVARAARTFKVSA